MKRRLREGAKLIVIDPRRIDMVRTPHIEAAHHLQLAPGSNVAIINAMAHVVVTEGLVRPRVRRGTVRGLRRVGGVHRAAREQPGVVGGDHRRARAEVRAAARLYAQRRQRGHLLRPRGHRAQPGLDDGHGHGQPGDGDRQHRPRGRRRQPAARAEQRAGLLRHGLLPPRAARLPARLRRRRCATSTRQLWGRTLDRPSRACGSRTCSTPRWTGPSSASTSRARTSPSPTPTPST